MRLGLLALLVGCSGGPVPTDDGLQPIRIGWQQTWATQGQLAVILMKTDILEKHGLKGDFKGFSYGGPLNEAALAGAVDVLFTADQPAIALGSRAPDWGIIGRLMQNRVGTVVPPDSPVQSAGDLRDKTVVVPFGAAAHRATIGVLEASGLRAGESVQVQNLGIQEIVALVGAGAVGGRWGSVDAAGAWDPALADLQTSGKVRPIEIQSITSVVVMDDDFSKAHPGVDGRFMAALGEAYAVYRHDPAQADAWFVAESALQFDRAVLTLAASVEPNLDGAGPARMTLDNAELEGIQKAAYFMAGAGLLREAVDTKALLRPTATSGR